MPNISGVSLLKSILLRSKHTKIKLVAYTADAKLAEDEAYKKLGFHDLLVKPINAIDLLKVVGLSAV